MYLYSALFVLYRSTSHSRRSGMDHTVLPAITRLLLPRKRSPHGAFMSIHLRYRVDFICAFMVN